MSYFGSKYEGDKASVQIGIIIYLILIIIGLIQKYGI